MDMLCSNCGKNTAKTYIRTSEGKEVKLLLCSDCYKKLYPEEEGDFFTQFLGNTEGKQSKLCPNCGMRLADFKKTGLLGCAKCYDAFRGELISTVRFIQWEVRHDGKRPSEGAEEKYDLVRELVRERDGLNAELERANAERNFAKVSLLKKRLAAGNLKISETEGD